MSRNYLSGTELANLKDQVKIDIRSILCSSKDGLTELELKRDYIKLNGEHIPYVELGYHSVYNLLKSFDFIETHRHRNGVSTVYHAIPDENSKDLARLIAGQKDPNKSLREKKRLNEPNRNFKFQNRPFFTRPQELYTETPKRVSTDVQKDIQDILRRSPNYRLNVQDLEFEYKRSTGFDLNPKKFGFQSMLQMFESLRHVVYVEKIASRFNEDFIVGLEFAAKENVETSEEEMIENLKALIESYKEGIGLKSLEKAYSEMFKMSLDFDKYGYSNLLQLFSNKLADFIELVQCEKTNDFLVHKKQSKSSDERSDVSQTSHTSLGMDKALFKKLLKLIGNALKNHLDKKLSEKEFLNFFEKANGHKLNHKDYGFKKLDQLASKLHENHVLRIEFDQNFDILYTLPSEFSNKKIFSSDSNVSLNSSTCNVKRNESSTSCNLNSGAPIRSGDDFDKEEIIHLDKKERQLYEWRKYQAEFIQDYVTYDDTFTHFELHKNILVKREHEIIISNIVNPGHFQIQLVENIPSLNELMDNLEKVYYGVGSGYYDMPEEYVILGKLCVALFEMDNNWHRCRISKINFPKKEVYVEFIDYGGESIVQMNSLKFLLREFAFLPPQAIEACFSKIKSRPDNLWRKDTLNYLLNRVTGKKFIAKIAGLRGSFCSVEVLEKTPVDFNGRPKGTVINLNRIIVQDGYADFYDEESDTEFLPFLKWQEQYELTELDEMYSRKSLCQSTGELSSYSIANHSTKDINNNDSTSLKSNQPKIEYKQIDEMKIDSIMKEKSVRITINDREHVLNLLWIDGKRYVHYTQIIEMIGLSENLFEDSLQCYRSKHTEIVVTTFLNKPQNEELFNWLQYKLGLCYENGTETRFFVYENLLKYIKYSSPHKTFQQVSEQINSKVKKSKPIRVTYTEANHEISLFDKRIENLKERLKKAKDGSSDYENVKKCLDMWNAHRENYVGFVQSL